MTNFLYYGDNLRILRDYVRTRSVDLIYLDPPFNSNANYNLLFREKTGEQSAAQITVFEDTWQWTKESEAIYHETVETAPADLVKMLEAMRSALGTSDMMAYLTMMAPRIVELYRVLKETGTFYLHCDPTASHYIKLMLDAVFGPRRFLNEISWKRSSAHSDTKQGMMRCGKIRDVLLVYTKSDEYTWNPQFTPYTQEYLESEYRHIDEDGRHYKETDVTAAKPGGDTEYEWRVKRRRKKGAPWEADLTEEYKKPKAGYEYKGVPPYNGRFWAYSKENMRGFAESGNLIHRKTGAPRLVQYADEMPGIPLQDSWDDIPPASGGQDLGYPTQKPEALLERIITASSNKGDVVLDPFCGCGTTISVAEGLHRQWIGIDVTHLAISLIRHRLHSTYQSQLAPYKVIGDPTDVRSAEALAEQDRYQFQWWAVGLVGGRAAQDKKRGKDSGVDGRLFFIDDNSGKAKQVILQVKSGALKPDDLRALSHVVQREGAQIGALITLRNPTGGMRKEAIAAGYYQSQFGKFPRLQVLTIEDLLHGKKLEYPPTINVTHRRAEVQSKARVEQGALIPGARRVGAQVQPRLPGREFSDSPLLDILEGEPEE